MTVSYKSNHYPLCNVSRRRSREYTPAYRHAASEGCGFWNAALIPWRPDFNGHPPLMRVFPQRYTPEPKTLRVPSLLCPIETASCADSSRGPLKCTQ